MHRIVINFGGVRQVGRTTAMLAIFEKIIGSVVLHGETRINKLIYVTRNESEAERLARTLSTAIRTCASSGRMFKGFFGGMDFSIVGSSSLQLMGHNGIPSACKCPNCGYVAKRKKAVIFLDGTVNRIDDIKNAFPVSEWDVDFYIAD